LANPSPAECVIWYLLQHNVVVMPGNTGWIATIGQLPASPNACVTAYDTGGSTPNPLWLIDYASVQVMIRTDVMGYQSGYAKAQEVKDTLLGVSAQAVYDSPNQVWWSGITMMGDIAFIHYDDTQRAHFSLNFRIYQEQSKSVLSNRNPLDYTGL